LPYPSGLKQPLSIHGDYSHTSIGIDLTSIEWFQAGVNQAGRKEKVKLNLPSGTSYTACPDKSISEMLLNGDVDAALSARPPNAFLHHPETVTRLFTNYRAVEMDYWQRTQIFPIMHVIGIRREVYEANRWIARNLMDAFETAKNRSLERAADITASYYPIPWAADYAQASQAILGQDFWPYGFEENASTFRGLYTVCF
jgi:4,5-dihydroxyphthalate decarboxylase